MSIYDPIFTKEDHLLFEEELNMKVTRNKACGFPPQILFERQGEELTL